VDIRFEDNDVATFRVALVVLSAYTAREVVLWAHIWFLGLKFHSLFVHEMWLYEPK